jgi:choline dehydrogenase-like flavoprotein
MNVERGDEISRHVDRTADVIVVGSGPAGAAVARTLARGGASVLVVEEGPWVQPQEMPEDGFTSMVDLYRDMGTSLLMGNIPMPYLQGRVVGGTSVINGAISWRLPRDVYDEWVAADAALAEDLPWSTIDSLHDQVEADLCIQPTQADIAGDNNLLLAKGAEALGLEHRPIARNVDGCRGLGRCLQGCPEGRKKSMDLTYLPEACDHGAVILSSTRVEAIESSQGRAVGVLGRTSAGGAVRLRARGAIVLAASAVQTPAVLQRSGIRQGPVGHNFQCHPGVSMVGRFPETVRMWTGATQGHEVIGLRADGLKFEALGYDMALVAMRTKGVGLGLSRDIADLARFCNWGAAIRSSGRGRVRARRRSKGVRVSFSLTKEDLSKVRRGVRLMGEMMLAAGADFVTPGVPGWHQRVTDRSVMSKFDDEGPTDPKAYTMAVTHMFGTCRMGSDPMRSVTRPDFRHHHVKGLYVADSSVFPSNTGVNPQTSIIALAALCGQRVLSALSRG